MLVQEEAVGYHTRIIQYVKEIAKKHEVEVSRMDITAHDTIDITHEHGSFSVPFDDDTIEALEREFATAKEGGAGHDGHPPMTNDEIDEAIAALEAVRPKPDEDEESVQLTNEEIDDAHAALEELRPKNQEDD